MSKTLHTLAVAPAYSAQVSAALRDLDVTLSEILDCLGGKATMTVLRQGFYYGTPPGCVADDLNDRLMGY